MDILQRPFRIVPGAHAQIFLIFPVPDLREIRYRHIVLDEHFFDLIPDQHMERIRQLVRLGPYKARRGPVYSRQKIVQGHAFKRFPKDLCHPPIDRLPKGPASPDDIFKKTRLALMHAHRRTLPQHGLRQIIPDPELIQRMPRLMDHGKDRRIDPFSVVRGNPHIVIVQVRRKGMGAHRHHAPVKIKAHILCQKARGLLLRVKRIIR